MKPFGWKKPSNHRSWCLPGTSTTRRGGAEAQWGWVQAIQETSAAYWRQHLRADNREPRDALLDLLLGKAGWGCESGSRPLQRHQQP